MKFVKVQISRDPADRDAYARLRDFPNYPDLSVLPILNARQASRFDCSTAYRPALDAVKAGHLWRAYRIIEEAGVFESDEAPPDWCYDRS